ncbi:unnamed protein product [Caenorhabditis sp. 36 PRJEB53466]|nr:unnamed protein product [Caenorhabditis sp. 36 PRJEB53466]
MFVKLLSDILLFCKPMLLKSLIQFTEQLERPMWQGFVLAFTIFGSAELSSILLSHFLFLMYRVGTHVQTCLTSAVYRKTLRLSNAARREKTVGEIVNLMAIDIDRFQQITPQTMVKPIPNRICFVPALPATGSLSLQWSCRDGAFVSDQLCDHDDHSQVLEGTKDIKLYVWGPPMENVIEDLREKELGLIKKAAFLRTFSDMLNTASPFLVPLSTFTTFICIDPKNVLTPEIAFASLTLFNQLSLQMSQVAEFITQTVQVSVSNRRVKEFLKSEKLNEDAIDCKGRNNNDIIASWCHASTLSPSQSTADNLSPLSDASERDIDAPSVDGRMENNSGSISMHGRLCYVPQQPWMQTMRFARLSVSRYKFVDLNVSRHDATRVAKEAPYILMYRKRRHGKISRTGTRKPAESPYNFFDASKRYLEHCPEAWEVIKETLENDVANN